MSSYVYKTTSYIADVPPKFFDPKKDKGKEFVRTNCCLSNSGRYDWSHLPKGPSNQDIKKVAMKFIGMSDTYLFFVSKENPSRRLSLDWNDGNWVLLRDCLQTGKVTFHPIERDLS